MEDCPIIICLNIMGIVLATILKIMSTFIYPILRNKGWFIFHLSKEVPPNLGYIILCLTSKL